MLNLASLNQRVNALTAKVNNIVPGGTQDLATTLGYGNSAGASDINMNANDILSCNNLQVTTINSSPYPPSIPADTFDAVLQAGNTAVNKTAIFTDGLTETTTLDSSTFEMKDQTLGTNLTTLTDTVTPTFSQQSVKFVDDVVVTDAETLIKSQQNQTEMTATVSDNTNNLHSVRADITIGGAMVENHTSYAPSISTPDRTVSSTEQINQTNALQSLSYTDNPSATQNFIQNVVTSGSSATTYTTGSTSTQTLKIETPFSGDAVIQHTKTGASNPNLTISTQGNLTLKATDLGGTTQGILIDKLTPNIYYPYNSSNPFDRLVISNNGIIESVSVGSSQAGQFGAGSLIYQDFVQQKTLDLTAVNITLQDTAVPAKSTSLTLPQLAFNDSGSVNSTMSSSNISLNAPLLGSSSINAGSATISATTATSATPVFTLQNSNATGTAPVSFECYKNKATAGTNGDEVFRLSMFGKNSGNTKEEYGRISTFIRDPSAPASGADGAMQLIVPINDAMTTMLDLNGNDGRVNVLRNMDMRTNSVVSTTGNVTLDASASSGTGSINLTTKAGVAGSGAGLVLSGNTLLSPTAGGASGQHLALTIGGTVYKIALLNN